MRTNEGWARTQLSKWTQMDLRNIHAQTSSLSRPHVKFMFNCPMDGLKFLMYKYNYKFSCKHLTIQLRQNTAFHSHGLTISRRICNNCLRSKRYTSFYIRICACWKKRFYNGLYLLSLYRYFSRSRRDQTFIPRHI